MTTHESSLTVTSYLMILTWRHMVSGVPDRSNTGPRCGWSPSPPRPVPWDGPRQATLPRYDRSRSRGSRLWSCDLDRGCPRSQEEDMLSPLSYNFRDWDKKCTTPLCLLAVKWIIDNSINDGPLKLNWPLVWRCVHQACSCRCTSQQCWPPPSCTWSRSPNPKWVSWCSQPGGTSEHSSHTHIHL